VGKPANTTATKEIIGDAIRNAGMRFGMALDLWAKTDLHAEPPNPAEPFVDAIKQERVWTSSEWLTGVRKEADEAGQLDFVLPRGGGKTLGDVIDARLEHLADSARIEAELRIEREAQRAEQEQQRKAAAAQVAAEHGVRQQPPAGAEPPADNAPPVTEDDVRSACGAVWLNPDALEQWLARGQAAGVVDTPSRPDEPDGPTLGQAMRRQVNELRRAQAQRSGTVRAAQAADQQQNGDWGATGERAG